MRLRVKKSDLALIATRTQGAISDRAMAYIGLRITEGELCATVADRVIVVYTVVPALMEQEGTTFVKAKMFMEVVRELPEGEITLEDSESFLVITAGLESELMMKLPLVEGKQWREPPELSGNNAAQLPSDKLNYMIDQVQFCVAQESPRNYGAVGFFHRSGSGKLRLVGTDGFRLSYSEIGLELPEEFLAEGVCLSKRALAELQRMCSEGFESIQLVIAPEQGVVAALVEGYRVFIRLSSVKYPKYEGVLPRSDLSRVKVSRPYLQSVSKRILLAADKSRTVQLKFQDHSLTLSSRTAGSSEGRESISLEDFEGRQQELAVNGKFLTDVFSTVGSDEIYLNFGSESEPIVIIPEREPTDCHSMHVLVPIMENNA